MPRPLTRRPLVVKVRNLVELLVREQPKVEQRRGKGRVYLSARELDEGREGQRHLSEFGVEGWVPVGSSRAQVIVVAVLGVGIVGVGGVVVVRGVVGLLRRVWGGRWVVP